MSYTKSSLGVLLKNELIGSIEYQLRNWDKTIQRGKDDMRKWNPQDDMTEQIIEDWIVEKEHYKEELKNLLVIVENAIKDKEVLDGKQVITLIQ